MTNNLIETKLEEIFPKSYYLFSDEIKYILTENNKTHDSVYLNTEQTKLVKKYIDSDLKILIYSFVSNKKTAFTIPGLIEKETLTTFSGLSDIINCTANLYKLNLKGELNNNRIMITSKIPNKILPIFIEKTLLTKFKERELIAIYLHEIGHWINYRLYFPKTLLINLYHIQHIFLNPFLFLTLAGTSTGLVSYLTDSGVLTTLGWFLLIFIITGICLTSLISAINIKNEYDSDDFTKQMGFGQELTNMLNKPISNDFPIKLDSEIEISKIVKMTTIMLSLVSPILYSLFWFFKNNPEDSIESHPDSHHRVKVLLADSLTYIKNNKYLISENFNNFEINLLEENLKNFDKLDNINFSGLSSSFNSLYTSYDNFIYINRKTIFPHKLIF